MNRKHLIAFTAAATAVFALAGCGTGSAQKAADHAAVNPAVTKVPQACLDALDNADTGFTYAGQIMTAASNLDDATMTALTEKLTELAPTYNANKAACRAAGGQ